MKWKEPEHGEIRIKKYLFTLIPITIDKETRWLEPVKVKQVYDIGWCENEWRDIEFID